MKCQAADTLPVTQSVGQSVKGSKIRLKANAIRVNEQCMQNCLPASFQLH